MGYFKGTIYSATESSPEVTALAISLRRNQNLIYSTKTQMNV